MVDKISTIDFQWRGININLQDENAEAIQPEQLSNWQESEPSGFRRDVPWLDRRPAPEPKPKPKSDPIPKDWPPERPREPDPWFEPRPFEPRPRPTPDDTWYEWKIRK